MRGRGGAIAALALTATLGGLAEALFLVIVSRSAFAITDGDDHFGIVAGIEVSVGTAVAIALALVLVRTALGVITASQPANVSNAAGSRKKRVTLINRS